MARRLTPHADVDDCITRCRLVHPDTAEVDVRRHDLACEQLTVRIVLIGPPEHHGLPGGVLQPGLSQDLGHQAVRRLPGEGAAHTFHLESPEMRPIMVQQCDFQLGVVRSVR